MDSSVFSEVLHWLAYGLGPGLSPFAPGTVGTLMALPLVWLMRGLSPLVYVAVIAALFFPGIYICAQTARDVGAVDPGFIVFDEIVGFLMAMYLIPVTWRWLTAAYIVYRAFDIFKPFPIGWIEDQLGLGSGIMADDLIAGIYTCLILNAARLIIRRSKSSPPDAGSASGSEKN